MTLALTLRRIGTNGSRSTRSTNCSHSESETKTEVLEQSTFLHDEMAHQLYITA
jgi:hypothetical protein